MRRVWWIAVVLLLAGCGQAPPADAHEGHDHSEEEHDHEHEGEEGVVSLTPEQIAQAGIRLAVVEAQGGSLAAVPGTVTTTTKGQALVTSPVAGKVVSLLVAMGDEVKAGQALAVIQAPDLADAQVRITEARRQLDAAQSLAQEREGELKIAQADVKAAEQNLAQQRALASAGAFSQAPVQAAEKDLTDARSELLALQTEEATHQEQLRRMERLFAEGLVSKVDLESARLEVQQDQIQIARAKARVSTAEAAYSREKRIAEENLLNRRELLTAETAVNQARNRARQAGVVLTSARQAAQRAQRSVLDAQTAHRALAGGGTVSGANVTLRAPLAGTISHIDATLGQAVERSTELLKVENLKSIWVTASVPQTQLADIRPGTRVRVSADAAPSRILQGVVQVIGTQLDPQTRTASVQCLVENAEGLLKPGMFAQVSFDASGSGRSVLVPRTAVQEMEGASVIFTPGDHEGEFEVVTVTLGKRSGDLVEVISGLNPGDEFVVEGGFTLKAQAMKGELGHGHAH